MTWNWSEINDSYSESVIKITGDGIRKYKILRLHQQKDSVINHLVKEISELYID